MATLLYRLGGWSFRRRWTVLGLWGVLLAAVIASAVAFGGTTNDKFSVPGTESQDAQDLLEAKFPAASGTYARIVFAAPDGQKVTDPDKKAAIEATLDKAEHASDVSGVTDPFKDGTITKDGRIAYGDVIYPVPAHEIDDKARDELAATAGPAEQAGLQVEYGGGLVAGGEGADPQR